MKLIDVKTKIASQVIPHKDEGQVALDVIRSFTHLATDSSEYHQE